MAKLTIAGREFDLAPLKLGQLKQAAPFIDKINARGAVLDTVEGMMESSSDICSALAVATIRVDAQCGIDWLLENVGFADLPAISAAFRDLLTESGLAPAGEAGAPAQAPVTGQEQAPQSA